MSGQHNASLSYFPRTAGALVMLRDRKEIFPAAGGNAPAHHTL
jgi:hypothetical protein